MTAESGTTFSSADEKGTTNTRVASPTEPKGDTARRIADLKADLADSRAKLADARRAGDSAEALNLRVTIEHISAELAGLGVQDEDETSETDTPPAEEAPDYSNRNHELRQQFLECNRRIKDAQATGDRAAEAKARSDREAVANAFVALNVRLATHNARSMLRGEARADHMQAALLGLWEAFVGTDGSRVDDVVVDEDGVHAAAGWDPSKGQFSTFAGQFVKGAVSRSVRSAESRHTGMSYNTYGARPKVLKAVEELTDELGRSPNVSEIAARAGVTEETVRVVTTKAPASLQTPIGEDGGTLGDLIAADMTDPDDGDLAWAPEAEEQLVERIITSGLSGADLLAFIMRAGITGRPPVGVARTADKLAVGRGTVGNAFRRVEKALGLTKGSLDIED